MPDIIFHIDIRLARRYVRGWRPAKDCSPSASLSRAQRGGGGVAYALGRWGDSGRPGLRCCRRPSFGLAIVGLLGRGCAGSNRRPRPRLGSGPSTAASAAASAASAEATAQATAAASASIAASQATGDVARNKTLLYVRRGRRHAADREQLEPAGRPRRRARRRTCRSRAGRARPPRPSARSRGGSRGGRRVRTRPRRSGATRDPRGCRDGRRRRGPRPFGRAVGAGEAEHLVPGGEQLRYDRRSDPAGCSGDEDTHGGTSWGRVMSRDDITTVAR